LIEGGQLILSLLQFANVHDLVSKAAHYVTQLVDTARANPARQLEKSSSCPSLPLNQQTGQSPSDSTERSQGHASLETDLARLEKDNFYYRQTNRDLKLKLREFVAVHEKQLQALTKAKEKRGQLKEANLSLFKELSSIKVRFKEHFASTKNDNNAVANALHRVCWDRRTIPRATQMKIGLK
jgi:hypothetical protein